MLVVEKCTETVLSICGANWENVSHTFLLKNCDFIKTFNATPRLICKDCAIFTIPPLEVETGIWELTIGNPAEVLCTLFKINPKQIYSLDETL